MILEFIQFYDLLRGRPHSLILYFIIFVIVNTVVFRYFSGKYRPYVNKCRYGANDVTVVLPLLNEDPTILKKCILSINRQKPKELIIVYDGKGNDLEIINGIKEIKPKIIRFDERIGKRKAVVAAINNTGSDFVLVLDSDTILREDNCIDEMLRPMEDTNVGSVSPISSVYQTGSYISYVMSNLVERSRTVVNKSLNGGLVVAYGSCSLWRRDILIRISPKYLNQRFFGKLIEAGEDRFLTREAEKMGYKTVVQSTAMIDVATPPTFRSYLVQQIRWMRSGIMYYFLDLKERNIPSRLYLYHCSTYYLAPIFFLFALIYDIIINPSTFNFTILEQVSMLVIGVTSITIFRANAKLRYRIKIHDALICGLVGLFILFPASLYAYLTIGKQKWMKTEIKKD